MLRGRSKARRCCRAEEVRENSNSLQSTHLHVRIHIYYQDPIYRDMLCTLTGHARIRTCLRTQTRRLRRKFRLGSLSDGSIDMKTTVSPVTAAQAAARAHFCSTHWYRGRPGRGGTMLVSTRGGMAQWRGSGCAYDGKLTGSHLTARIKNRVPF